MLGEYKLNVTAVVIVRLCDPCLSSIVVDTWFGRSMFFPSYGFTERKGNDHSSDIQCIIVQLSAAVANSY